MKCLCKEYADPIVTMQDITARSNAEIEIAKTLEGVASSAEDWRSVRKCKICGQLWCQEYPFSEQHGGGAKCLYQIVTDNPEEWLLKAEYVTTRIRREYEEQQFMDSLGPEVGPEMCKYSECGRYRIEHSIFCKRHHLDNLVKARNNSR
jgi:hypothetical protein